MSASEGHEYRPKPGSVPWRVVKFLLANPDEELTRGDIAVKFDTFGGGIDGVLQTACARGILKKSRNRDMEVVWMLGTNKNVVMDEYVEGVAPDLSGAIRSMASPAGGGATTVPGMDTFPEIRKNTPLLDAKTRRRHEFHAWLERFDVHDSAEFPDQFLIEIRSMVKSYAIVAEREFQVVKVADGRWGVERLA